MKEVPFAPQACYALALAFFLTLAYAGDMGPPAPRLPKLRPVCNGPLPRPPFEITLAHISGYRDLTEWCVRSPLDCSCVVNLATHGHEVRCSGAQAPWLPVAHCYGGCNCEEHAIDAFIAALERVLPPLDDNGRVIA